MSTTLEALCMLITDGTHYTPPNVGEGMPFLTVVDMQEGGLNFVDCSRITQADFAEASRQKSVPKRGDVLFSKDGTVGKVHVVNGEQPFAILSSIAILRPDREKLDSGYLAHFLRTPEAMLAADRSKTGSALRRIILKDIKRLEVSPPPLLEQKRIAAILDRADDLRRKRQSAAANVRRLGRAIFQEMFGNVTLNDRGWRDHVTLGDASEVISGITKGRKLKGLPVRPVPFMTVATVQDGFLKLDTVKTIEATEQEINRYRLEPSDILLTEGGDPDKLGRGAIWNGELAECIHQNHVFRVRVRDEKLHPVFAAWLLGSSRGKSYFLRSAKQTTGIASINSSQLKAFPLLLPPLDVQVLFARRLEQLKREIRMFDLAAAEQQALFSSLQHRAFCGEL